MVLSIAVWANVFAYKRFFCTAVAKNISEAVTHSTKQSWHGVGTTWALYNLSKRHMTPCTKDEESSTHSACKVHYVA